MLTPETIQVRSGEGGRLIVRIPYSPDHVAKIKTVAGRRWHAQERHWTVPRGGGTLGKLQDLFPGQLIDCDPALGAVRTQDNGKPSSSVLAPVLVDLRVALQARHYSKRTEQAYGLGSPDFCTSIRAASLPKWPSRR